MQREGSDKGLARHNCATIYSALFAPMLQKPSARLFELGIGTNNPDLPSSMGAGGTPGASLRGWAKWLPQARVFGADIDRAILFREERIQAFYCDQCEPEAIRAMWAEAPLRAPLDIVIEDGLHTFEANMTFLDGSIGKVAVKGYYVVEDIGVAIVPRWEAMLPELGRRCPQCCFAVVRLPWLYNDEDNSLLIAHRVG